MTTKISTKSRLNNYLKIKQGMSKKTHFLDIVSTNVAHLGKIALAASLPIIAVQELKGQCQGSYNSGAAVNFYSGSKQFDIDGDGTNDIVIGFGGGFSTLVGGMNGVQLIGTMGASFLEVRKFALNEAIPGAYANASFGRMAFSNNAGGNWMNDGAGFMGVSKPGGFFGFVQIELNNSGTPTSRSIKILQSGFGQSAGNIVAGNCNSLLPVELLSFKAKSNKSQIALVWQTASETNNAGFEVQRSSNGKNWKNLHFIEGKGTTSEVQDYVYDDKDLRKGQRYFYRLKQIDYDGKFEYSDVINARLESDQISGTFSPNPVSNGQTRLDYITKETGTLNLRIFDVSGKELMQQEESVKKGDNRFDLDLSALEAGMFFVKMEQGGMSAYQKLILK